VNGKFNEYVTGYRYETQNKKFHYPSFVHLKQFVRRTYKTS